MFHLVRGQTPKLWNLLNEQMNIVYSSHACSSCRQSHAAHSADLNTWADQTKWVKGPLKHVAVSRDVTADRFQQSASSWRSYRKAVTKCSVSEDAAFQRAGFHCAAGGCVVASPLVYCARAHSPISARTAQRLRDTHTQTHHSLHFTPLRIPL